MNAEHAESNEIKLLGMSLNVSILENTYSGPPLSSHWLFEHSITQTVETTVLLDFFVQSERSIRVF